LIRTFLSTFGARLLLAIPVLAFAAVVALLASSLLGSGWPFFAAFTLCRAVTWALPFSTISLWFAALLLLCGTVAAIIALATPKWCISAHIGGILFRACFGNRLCYGCILFSGPCFWSFIRIIIVIAILVIIVVLLFVVIILFLFVFSGSLEKTAQFLHRFRVNYIGYFIGRGHGRDVLIVAHECWTYGTWLFGLQGLLFKDLGDQVLLLQRFGLLELQLFGDLLQLGQLHAGQRALVIHGGRNVR
jgi:hypothetical protein